MVEFTVTTCSVIASEAKQSSDNNAFRDALDCHAAKSAARNGENCDNFPFKAPKSFMDRINNNDPNDPLLLQVLPQECELQDVPGFTSDPLDEAHHSPIPGLIHKYQDRILLQVVDDCAINCRFCFRRCMRNKIDNWEAVLNYITSNIQVSEVILSGGDPLILKYAELLEIIQRLARIPHLKRLRIHTRMPIIMPEYKLPLLTQTRLKIIVVVHCNHPNEINIEVAKAVNYLNTIGVTVLNQSVLLKNINDNAEVLVNLSEKLFSIGVMPYYLHILDKVKGAAHFDVDVKEAKQIYAQMQANLPGYLVPKLVIDTPEKKKYI